MARNILADEKLGEGEYYADLDENGEILYDYQGCLRIAERSFSAGCVKIEIKRVKD